jgi:hypothetical protein
MWAAADSVGGEHLISRTMQTVRRNRRFGNAGA